MGVTPRKSGKTAVSKNADSGDTSRGQLFVSWNVNGLRAVLGKGFAETLESLNADIVALQEIKAHPEQLPEEITALAGFRKFWHPAERKGYYGTAIFRRIEPLAVHYGIGKPEFDCEGRVLTLEFADYFFVTAYFPNAQDELKRLDFKLAFDTAMLEYLNRLRAQKTVLLCGDFNVAHKEIDLARPRENRGNPGFSDEERAWMDSLLAEGYVDTFRKFCPDPGQYSWWSYRANARAKNIGWRIDYFVVDAQSENRVLEAAIHSGILGSDHCPVSIRFK
ncbi:MAG: exodeoxyribonuclease III [Deltaproteobacteria bacterium]|nr:exodeoxyribonuclease III [Deltaproteobacteria bacterium]